MGNRGVAGPDNPRLIDMYQVLNAADVVEMVMGEQDTGQALADDWHEVTAGNVASHGVPSQPDVALDLDAALANLPETSRAVVWLHDVEGFTHKEIAAMMGKTESFSKSQLSRAYQKLRPLLSVAEDELGGENAALRGC